MNRSDIGTLIIVISRDEVERQDISAPLSTLKSLLVNRDSIRANQLNVAVSFHGYDDSREELFEIPEVRNYVYALDAQFPFWLYFLSRYFTGLQCLACCHLLPYLTPEAQQQSHPKKLAELIENRWGPALLKICSAAGHSEAEADALLESAMGYFTSGPTKLVEKNDDEFDEELREDDDSSTTLFALKPSQEYVKVCLEKACRAALARPGQNPHSFLLGALFLSAVQRLPFASEQFAIKLSWKIDYGESWGLKTITIGDGGLSLDTTEAFNSGMGWDHESTVDWSVDESRQRGLDELVLEDVLTALATDMSDPDCEVRFSTDTDHPYDEIAEDPIDWDSAFSNKGK